MLNAALDIHHVIVTEAVQFFRGDADFDERLDVIKDLASQAAGEAHFSICSGVLMLMLIFLQVRWGRAEDK